MKRLSEALSILLKYDEKATIQGEHDALYIHVDPSAVSVADIDSLYQLGVHIDEDLDCFIRHT